MTELIAPDAFRPQHSSCPLLGPAEFRTYYNKWRKTAPANDSDIIPDKPKVSNKARHADLSADLKPLLQWKELQEDTGDYLQTNFLQNPQDEEFDQDNNEAKGVERDALRSLNDGPSVEQMLKSVEGIAFKERHDLVLCGLEYAWVTRRVLDLNAPQNFEPAISYHNKNKQECKRARVILDEHSKRVVYMKHVRFSAAEGDERRPLGSIVSWGLKVEERKRKKHRVLGARNLKIAPAPDPRFDPEQYLIRKQHIAALNDNLDPRHVLALNAAISSPSFESVGIKLGYAAGKTAERWGKRLTLDACKAFTDLKQQLAA